MKTGFLFFFLSISLSLISIPVIFSFSDKKVSNKSKSFQKSETFDSLPAPPDSVPALSFTDENGKLSKLRMNELTINVEVLGNIARTTMEMSFENKTDRVLEGEITFPLGEGQTVTRFALDVNGAMREGVVVEKQKGQQIFEAVIRQKIDPGLLEKTSGNNFKARVYPIPANGNKRMIIAYEQELVGTKNGNLYLLPLQFKDKLDKFSLKVEVFKQKAKPVLEQNELTNFQFKQWNDSYIAKIEQTNYTADKQIGFALPQTDNIYSAFIEKSTQATDADYFYINLKPEKYFAEKRLPKNICLLLDISASAEKKDTLKEIDLLDKYFKKINNLNVTLITFSNEIHLKSLFEVKNGNWNDLKANLLNPVFDGATQLGCLDLTKIYADEYILISDGMSNFGRSEIVLGKTPVFTINSTQSADFSYLKYIAASTGGQYINLKKTTVELALSQLSEQSYHFISADFNSNEVLQVYPSKPSDFTTNFSLAGQLKSPESEITLNFGFGSKVLKSVKIHLSKSDIITESNLIGRVWAEKKIAELDMLHEKNKDEITALGKKYTIVTRNTSLIVLDRLEDYVQYEIVPPAELQKEYFEIVENKKTEQNNLENEHIETVVGYFNTRIEWWNKDFPKEKKIVQNDNKTEVGNGNYVAPSVVDSLSREEINFSITDDDLSKVVVSEEREPIVEQVFDNEFIISGKKDKEKGEESRQSSIELNAWDPATPYMTKIKAAAPENRYKEYLKQKKEYGSTPAFFLDVSNYFEKLGNKKLALRILSNIAEMQTENHELMRILAHRLEQLEYYDLAISVYEQVLKIRGEEPQSYRDLSLCLAAGKQYQKALDMIYDAIKKPWDSRFPEIEGIMAVEMNRVISNADGKIDISKIDKRLIKSMPTDVRIVLNWDTDNSDMDLWVIDPFAEKCYYGAPLSYTGGRMSRDFTRGYGPEEFLIKEALTGKYVIQANYYGSTAQRITGPTTIYLEIYTNYGRKGEKKQTITMQLESQAAVVDIGVLDFSKKE